MNAFIDPFREDLIKVFRAYGVRFAYIFGSQVTGQANRDSDVDIAVMLPQKSRTSKQESSKRFDIRLKLIAELNRVLKEEVDVIILNDVKSLFFRYVIMKEGQLIYTASEDERVSFEYKTMNDYFDFAPFLEAYNRAYVARDIQ